MQADDIKMLGFLATVFELRAKQRLMSVQHISEKESALNLELANTRDLHKRSVSAAHGSAGFQQMGGDIRWAAWYHATTRQLNMDLARARAQKAPLVAQAQRHLARAEAAKVALETRALRDRKAAQGSALERTQNLGLLAQLGKQGHTG